MTRDVLKTLTGLGDFFMLSLVNWQFPEENVVCHRIEDIPNKVPIGLKPSQIADLGKVEVYLLLPILFFGHSREVSMYGVKGRIKIIDSKDEDLAVISVSSDSYKEKWIKAI